MLRAIRAGSKWTFTPHRPCRNLVLPIQIWQAGHPATLDRHPRKLNLVSVMDEAMRQGAKANSKVESRSVKQRRIEGERRWTESCEKDGRISPEGMEPGPGSIQPSE